MLPEPQDFSGDDQAAEFAGTGSNGSQTHISVDATHFVFVGVAISTMNLHGIVGDFLSRFGCKQ